MLAIFVDQRARPTIRAAYPRKVIERVNVKALSALVAPHLHEIVWRIHT